VRTVLTTVEKKGFSGGRRQLPLWARTTAEELRSMPERPSPASSPTPSDVVSSFRQQLTVGEDAVDVAKWFPESYGIPPHVRVGRNRWFNLLWLLPIGFVVLISAVAVAQGLRTIPSVEDFIAGIQVPSCRRRRTRTRGFPPGSGCNTSSTCS
jgi:methionine sulfoxide reductase catalytic subunit